MDQPGVHFNTNPVHHAYSTSSTTSRDNRYEPPANDSILQGASSAWQTNSWLTQPTQHIVTTYGDAMTGQILPHTWLHKIARPDQLVVVVSRTIHRILQMQGMDPHASNVENKAIWDWSAEKESTAHFAEPTTTTQRHAENNATTSQAPLTATSQQDTTQQ